MHTKMRSGFGLFGSSYVTDELDVFENLQTLRAVL